MNTTHWTDALVRFRVCGDAAKWCRAQPDPEAAWWACERGDWMAWLLAALAIETPWGSPERRRLAGAACEVLIALVRPLSNAITDAAIDTVIELLARHERGENVAESDFEAASANVIKVARSLEAARAVGTTMASEAAWAAEAAWTAGGATWAARAAWAAGAEGATWAAWAAWAASLAASADIIRARYPKAPRLL